ncbi:MAG: hypothetical protein WD187_02340 [Candidatus Woykebacteria bacterium]
MSLKLFINTTIAKKAVVSLIDKGDKVIAQEKAEDPLVALDKLLKKTKTKLENIDEIASHPGPGSFTGLRVGAAVAQTLNFALGKKTKPPDLKYE